MNNKNTDQQPSQTALFTALRRTIAHKKYQDEKFGPDHLAEIFLPVHFRFFLMFKKIREGTKEKLAAFMPGMNEYLIARTAYFDRLFLDALQEEIPQIVLLGAGYDSRAYRFAKSNLGTRIFELDAAPTQNRKMKCLKSTRIRIPEEVRFVPIDFLSQSLSVVLENAGYKSQEKTLFLWEGVSYYLDRAAVKDTLSFVSRCSNRDSLIAFDYSISLSEEELPAFYGASKFLESMQEQHASEELLFSLKPGEVESFLADMNLDLVEHLDHDAIELKYLTDENGSRIGRMIGIFRFVCASPS
jgi:methyltransferase (TIGR00027 family)